MMLLLIGVRWLHILASIFSAALFLFELVIVAPFTSFPQPAPAFEVGLVECKPSSLRASPLGLMLSDVYSIYQSNTKMASSELLYFTQWGWGPPLLLVHGLMFTGEMFEPVVEHFATRHRVIVPDLRGHGRSRGLAPPYTAAHLASDLSRLLDHLGIDSTAVLGYSHGGAIAQQLVLDHPTRCNRLVLACTYAFNMATFRERLEGHLLPLLLDVAGMRRFAKFVVSQGLKQLGKQRADWVVGLIASQDRKLMVSVWMAAMAFDSRRRLAEIKCPTLVVAASRDEAVALHHAKMLHDGITGSKLVIIDGADHALIWARADELVRVIDEFLGA